MWSFSKKPLPNILPTELYSFQRHQDQNPWAAEPKSIQPYIYSGYLNIMVFRRGCIKITIITKFACHPFLARFLLAQTSNKRTGRSLSPGHTPDGLDAAASWKSLDLARCRICTLPGWLSRLQPLSDSNCSHRKSLTFFILWARYWNF